MGSNVCFGLAGNCVRVRGLKGGRKIAGAQTTRPSKTRRLLVDTRSVKYGLAIKTGWIICTGKSHSDKVRP